MKKFNIIFKLCFITYFLVLFAIPFITANPVADIIFYAFILSVVYQFTYIIFLMKGDNLSLGRCISISFLYGIQVLSFFIVIKYIDIYFNGYAETTITGQLINVYYGFEAWGNSVFINIICLPILFIAIIYTITYFAISNKNK